MAGSKTQRMAIDRSVAGLICAGALVSGLKVHPWPVICMPLQTVEKGNTVGRMGYDVGGAFGAGRRKEMGNIFWQTL